MTNENVRKLKSLEATLVSHFEVMNKVKDEIRKILEVHADGKLLKGDEIVGWLGEVYGKFLMNGTLVNETNDHDFETSDGKYVSVKARKGDQGKSWRRSSGIPKIEGDGCPTHLMFVRLSNNYLVHSVWLYEWRDLLDAKRFKEHKVRGQHRSYYMEVNESADKDNLIYPKAQVAA